MKTKQNKKAPPGHCGCAQTEWWIKGPHLLSCPLGEMVRQARVLAQATSDLVNAMRSDAEAEIDMENSKKLLAAAKLLADSTARMVEAAKVGHWSFGLKCKHCRC